MGAAYENYWSKYREPSWAEIVAARAKKSAEGELCSSLTKAGNPCKGYAGDDGLCVGHRKAVKAGTLENAS